MNPVLQVKEWKLRGVIGLPRSRDRTALLVHAFPYLHQFCDPVHCLAWGSCKACRCVKLTCGNGELLRNSNLGSAITRLLCAHYLCTCQFYLSDGLYCYFKSWTSFFPNYINLMAPNSKHEAHYVMNSFLLRISFVVGTVPGAGASWQRFMSSQALTGEPMTTELEKYKQ